MTVTYLPATQQIEDEAIRSNFEYIESHGLFDVTSLDSSHLAANAQKWLPLPLATGAGTGNWSSPGGGGLAAAQYALDSLGFVHLRGSVTNGTAVSYPSTNVLIGTLPVGFRAPAGRAVLWAGQADDTAGHIILPGLVVRTDGTLSMTGYDFATAVANSGSYSWVSLDACPPFQQGQ